LVGGFLLAHAAKQVSGLLKPLGRTPRFVGVALRVLLGAGATHIPRGLLDILQRLAKLRVCGITPTRATGHLSQVALLLLLALLSALLAGRTRLALTLLR
jgi:hypothetical protein